MNISYLLQQIVEKPNLGRMEMQPIIEKASAFVFQKLKDQLPKNYTYHTYIHTSETVEATEEIGRGINLPENELHIVILAAWFHDIGYIRQRENHEEISAEIAEEFLKSEGLDQETIDQVKKCILATKMPHDPHNAMEDTICDADMISLGSENQFQKSQLLRTEIFNSTGETYADEVWLSRDVEFMIEHTYKTYYAQKKFHHQKVQNVFELQKKLRKLSKKKERKKQQKEKLKIEKKKLEFKESKDSKPDRGIETMFRVTLRNHINLSAIADNKANIMLSINALIISFVLTSMMPKIGKFPYLAVPMLVLICTSILTIVYATLSTRPKITEGKFSKEDISNKTANLLFFGNFYNMDLEDFNLGFHEMMNDKEFLYDSLTKDFYFLGQVLGKKYRYLSICYIVFLVGLIASVLSFCVAIVLHYELI